MDPNRSPFDRLFDPDRAGTLTGMIGRASGVPTGLEREGANNGAALEELSRLRQEEGLDPQRAIMTFIQSPKGQSFMASGTSDFQGVMDKFLASTKTPPPNAIQTNAGQTTTTYDPNSGQQTGQIVGPTTVNTPGGTQTTGYSGGKPIPGSTTISKQPVNTGAGSETGSFDPNGGTVSPQRRVPGQRVQDFGDFASLTNVPKPILAQLAEIHLIPDALQKEKQMEKAINGMVDRGELDHATAAKYLSGAFETIKAKNAAGEDTGDVIILDKIGQRATYVQATDAQGNPVSKVPENHKVQPGASAIPAEARRPDGSVDWNKVKDPKVTMFLGAGPAATASELVTRGANIINPGLAEGVGYTAGDITMQRRAQAENLTAAMTSLTDRANDLGTPSAVVKMIMRVQESAAKTFSDPQASLIDAIALRDRLEREIGAGRVAFQDKNLPQKEKNIISQNIEAYQKILRELPSHGDMQTLLTDYKAGNSGAPGVKEAVKGVLGAGKDAAGKVLGNDSQPDVSQPASPKAAAIIKTIPTLDAAGLIQLRQSIQNDPAMVQQLGPLISQRAREIQGASKDQGKAPGGALPFGPISNRGPQVQTQGLPDIVTNGPQPTQQPRAQAPLPPGLPDKFVPNGIGDVGTTVIRNGKRYRNVAPRGEKPKWEEAQ